MKIFLEKQHDTLKQFKNKYHINAAFYKVKASIILIQRMNNGTW